VFVVHGNVTLSTHVGYMRCIQAELTTNRRSFLLPRWQQVPGSLLCTRCVHGGS